MAIIIRTNQDDGTYVSITDLTERVLDAAPEATVRIVKGNVSGVEVDDASAVKYLMTLYTAKGNRKGGGNG